MALRIVPALLALVLAGAMPAPAADDAEMSYAALRYQLVRWIEFHAVAAREQTGVKAIDPRVLRVMGEIPRHEFVPAPLRHLAYLDTPLPLGHGQSISQPFIIALMTHLARVGEDDVVFETGTGAGYQAAILARLARRVYSVEYVEPLAVAAAATLARLGYANVETRASDGYFGWSEMGPFDVILVKEAIHHVPRPLLGQLKPGGRMVIPVGPQEGVQQLTLIEKGLDGRLKETRVLPVKFAPLQGGERI